MSARESRLRRHRSLALVTLGIGVALLVMMIVVEDEPGAIPLLLILGGGGWYLVTRARARTSTE